MNNEKGNNHNGNMGNMIPIGGQSEHTGTPAVMSHSLCIRSPMFRILSRQANQIEECKKNVNSN